MQGWTAWGSGLVARAGEAVAQVCDGGVAVWLCGQRCFLFDCSNAVYRMSHLFGFWPVHARLPRRRPGHLQRSCRRVIGWRRSWQALTTHS